MWSASKCVRMMCRTSSRSKPSRSTWWAAVSSACCRPSALARPAGPRTLHAQAGRQRHTDCRGLTRRGRRRAAALPDRGAVQALGHMPRREGRPEFRRLPKGEPWWPARSPRRHRKRTGGGIDPGGLLIGREPATRSGRTGASGLPPGAGEHRTVGATGGEGRGAEGCPGGQPRADPGTNQKEAAHGQGLAGPVVQLPADVTLGRGRRAPAERLSLRPPPRGDRCDRGRSCAARAAANTWLATRLLLR